MTHIIISLFACAIGLLAILAYRRFSAFERSLAGRLDLVLRASHTCASKLSVADKKIERLHHDQRVAFVHQKKANEHHRVLLASLHRQVRQLEEQFQNGNTGSAAGRKAATGSGTKAQQPSAPVETPQTGKILKQAAVRAGNPKSGVIRLEEMFEAMPASLDPGQASRNADPEEEIVTRVRRVAHG